MNIKRYLAAGLGALVIGTGTVKMCKAQQEAVRSNQLVDAYSEAVHAFYDDTTNLAPLEKDTVDFEKTKKLVETGKAVLRNVNLTHAEAAKCISKTLHRNDK